MDDDFKIHPLFFLAVGGVLMYIGNAPSKKASGLDAARDLARKLFVVDGNCVMSIEGTGDGTTVEDAEKLHQEYFYPVLGQSYLDGIIDEYDNADYILKDLFPKCEPPFTGAAREPVVAHVLNLKLEGLGFAPDAEGIEAFQQYWNRFIAVLERINPNAIAANPGVYQRIEQANGSLNDPTRRALSKAYTRWANLADGKPIIVTIGGKSYHVDNFWDLVETSEAVIRDTGYAGS